MSASSPRPAPRNPHLPLSASPIRRWPRARVHAPGGVVVCLGLCAAVWAAALAPAPLAAQEPMGVPPGTTLEGDPADVGSLDAIMSAVYDVISGPAGEARDWDRFRSLFMPGARLIPTGSNAEGRVGARVMSPADYAEQVGPALEEGGFFEVELGRRVERFGPVVHALSAYASFRREDDAEPFARGVNSFQLLDAGDRWYVVSIFWASETPANPIPSDLSGG